MQLVSALRLRTRPLVGLFALVVACVPAVADQATADEALTLYTDAVAAQGEPTPEMLDDVTRRLLDALPKERVTPLVIDRMLTGIEDPSTGAALVMVLDELDVPRGALLQAAVDRLAHEDEAVKNGASAYLGGFLVRPEIDLDTKLLILELLEPAAEHAAPLAPSLLALQLLQHGRNTPSMIKAIDEILAVALADPGDRVMHGLPGLVELARADEGNLRGLSMLKLGQWGIATPSVVDVLIENASYKEGDATLAKRVRIVAVQTLGDLIPAMAALDPQMGFRVQRELVTAGANEADEGLRDLIVHVSTKLGSALGQTMSGRTAESD